MTTRRRLIGGAFALGAVRLAQLLTPLIQLPVFIQAWGLDSYGGWISANAIGALATLACLSFHPAFCAEIAIRLSKGEHALIHTINTTGFISTLLSSALLYGSLCLGYLLLEQSGYYRISGIDNATVAILVASFAISAIPTYCCSIMGALGHYSLGNAIEAGRRILELISIIVLVYFLQWSPFTISLVLLAFSVLAAFYNIIAISKIPNGSLLKGSFSTLLLKSLQKSIAGSFLLSFSYAQLFVTGPRILIGWSLGNAAVVEFTLLTNLVRVTRQVADVLIYPFQADFSFAFGASNFDKLRTLFFLGTRLSLWAGLICCAGILVVGPPLVTLLSRSLVDTNYALLATLVAAMVFECASLSAIIFLIAIGRTFLSSAVLLVSGIVVLSMAFAFSSWLGLMGFGIASVVGTAIYAITLWAITLPLVRVGKRELFRESLSPPIADAVAELRRLLNKRSTLPSMEDDRSGTDRR